MAPESNILQSVDYPTIWLHA